MLSFSPSSEAGEQIRQWFTSPGYGFSPPGVLPVVRNSVLLHKHCLDYVILLAKCNSRMYDDGLIFETYTMYSFHVYSCNSELFTIWDKTG
jgi:hypothetical protein